jgi:hypothetical protein
MTDPPPLGVLSTSTTEIFDVNSSPAEYFQSLLLVVGQQVSVIAYWKCVEVAIVFVKVIVIFIVKRVLGRAAVITGARMAPQPIQRPMRAIDKEALGALPHLGEGELPGHRSHLRPMKNDGLGSRSQPSEHCTAEELIRESHFN